MMKHPSESSTPDKPPPYPTRREFVRTIIGPIAIASALAPALSPPDAAGQNPGPSTSTGGQVAVPSPGTLTLLVAGAGAIGAAWWLGKSHDASPPDGSGDAKRDVAEKEGA